LKETGLFLTGPSALDAKSRCYHVEIVGPHDGQHVYILMEARRSMSTEECNEKNLDACDDLYVIESVDNGQNWLPARLAGGKPGDAVRRRTFKALTNWNTPYIVLMYSKFVGAAMSLNAIRYDTKKGIFEHDTVLVPKFSGLDYYQLTTIDDSGASTHILIYATPYTLALQTLISNDNGATWKKGDSLRNVCEGAKFTIKHVTSKGKYLIAGCSKTDKIHFSFSSDLGKSWTAPALFPYHDIEDVSFCTPEDPLSNKYEFMALFRDKRSLKMGHSSMPLGELKIADVPDAFYYAAYKMDVNCYYRAKELKVRFMYHVRSPYQGVSKYTLYVIDNDDINTTPVTEHKEDL